VLVNVILLFIAVSMNYYFNACNFPSFGFDMLCTGEDTRRR